ncbi:hypothetical protein LXA47_03740 [Massilia sp. P8910]|uniref:hypothetical protein n=1 Tax=Massilia antarctica TaxID=2765360 RepID=UPI001E445595|nr:hypothetical protein [Massilia antarctica]MCE3602711.1 hypothetical protein [Massilia antarctica]
MKLQWHDLRDRLLDLDDDAAPEAIFKTLVAGFRKYRPQFSSAPFSTYRFARYFSMQAADYPVAQSALRDAEFRHFKTSLRKYEVSPDLDSIAGLLREAMEQLVTLHVEHCCPRCGHWDFATYKSVAAAQFVIECAVCGHVEGRNGEPYAGGTITLPDAHDLLLPGRAAAPATRPPLPPYLTPRIRIDAGDMLNYNLVILSRRDEEADCAGAVIGFYRGMPVAIVADDTDEQGQPGYLIADGHADPVAAAPTWAADARWLCRIDKKGPNVVSSGS